MMKWLAKLPPFRVTLLRWRIGWTGYMEPRAAFIEKIKPLALALEETTGIPWRFAMVQAAHESDYGSSGLTCKANNLFGITGDSWQRQGKPVYVMQTAEYSKERGMHAVERPFRKYASWAESLADWGSVVMRLYPKAWVAAKGGDFTTFAKEMAAGGYATDPAYAKKLIELHASLKEDTTGGKTV